MRCRVITLTLPALVLLTLASPGARPAFAHGLGQNQDLPLPLWLFLYGAAAAVLVSFVPISLFADRRRTPRGYPRFDLFRIGPLRALPTARSFLTGARLLSVALFLLVILTAGFGNMGFRNPRPRFALLRARQFASLSADQPAGEKLKAEMLAG